eukprot:s498_g27.t1
MFPFAAVARSLARGVATPGWRAFWDYEQQIQAPGMGLLVPYGMTLIQDLDPVSAIAGITMVVAAAASLASARVDFNCDWPGQRGQASVIYLLDPLTAYGLYTSYFIGSVAEFAAFAVVSSVLHPLLACLGYAVAIEVNTRFSANGFFMESWLAPHVMFFGLQTRVLGTPARRDLAGPGWPAALCMLLRLALLLGCCSIPLPEDREPWQRLGRPAGRAVLQDFAAPTRVAFGAAEVCILKFTCRAPDLTPSEWLRAALLSTVLILMPLHFGITIYRLAANSHFRDGTVDKELCGQIEAKRKEIEDFAAHSEQHPHEYELLAVEDLGSGDEEGIRQHHDEDMKPKPSEHKLCISQDRRALPCTPFAGALDSASAPQDVPEDKVRGMWTLSFAIQGQQSGGLRV